MPYQQLHAGKVKLSGLGGILHHLLDRNRVKSNPDIDLTRSRFNHSVEDLSPEHLITRVHQRIKQLNLKSKPRKDAVGLEDFIVGASADFMLKMGADKREQYFSDALHFFQNRYGTDNVMYCHCHMDESNPHVHIGVVPVTADGRLSARDLFNPKTLEQLQTDFHHEVSSHYGLERGEHNSRQYLELTQFKTQKVKQKLAQFSSDLQTAQINSQRIEQAQKSAQHPSYGILFKTTDRNKVEMPTDDFLLLRDFAQKGLEATAQINLLHEQIHQLQNEKEIARADEKLAIHQLTRLEKTTQHYTDVPTLWRTHIDHNIEQLQQTFTDFCHDVNRATLKTLVATHGDSEKTESLLRNFFAKAGVKKPDEHITNVLRAAKLQLKKKSPPNVRPPSWKPPKPTDTDYSLPDQTSIVPLQLSAVPDIDWNTITWELLSELEKDAIQNKKMIREL